MRTADAGPFQELLLDHTRPGELIRDLGDGTLECVACAHRCRLRDGKEGICRVRVRHGDALLVPWGYVSGLALDPVEKKPFFHALPGSTALSFGMLGCDYHCDYCQNWITSQALRDPAASSTIEELEPSDIVRAALDAGAKIVTSTYNEPLITTEWGTAVFREAKRAGLRTAYVSNGNATPEVLEYLRPWIDLYKVDLKGFDPKHYRFLGGRIEPVLETIRALHAYGIWTEVVTLLVPGWNDSEEELRGLTRFLASVSPLVPWHVTAFHPDYKMTDPDRTTASALVRAARIGEEEGLRYVYAGNLPGAVGRHERTSCHRCAAVLVEREGFRILRNVVSDGHCPSCRASIPGVWV
jgi:pyruvate formate lyase activating enzyme